MKKWKPLPPTYFYAAVAAMIVLHFLLPLAKIIGLQIRGIRHTHPVILKQARVADQNQLSVDMCLDSATGRGLKASDLCQVEAAVLCTLYDGVG